MKLKLAHYRNRFSMFRTYYALRAGLVKTDGLEFQIIEVPDPPSRELEDVLIRGEVDISNVYLPNFLERRLDGAPIMCFPAGSTIRNIFSSGAITARIRSSTR
jgi:hypothetical protein